MYMEGTPRRALPYAIGFTGFARFGFKAESLAYNSTGQRPVWYRGGLANAEINKLPYGEINKLF